MARDHVNGIAHVDASTARYERNRACGVHTCVHGDKVPQQSALHAQDDDCKTQCDRAIHGESIQDFVKKSSVHSWWILKKERGPADAVNASDARPRRRVIWPVLGRFGLRRGTSSVPFQTARRSWHADDRAVSWPARARRSRVCRVLRPREPSRRQSPIQ